MAHPPLNSPLSPSFEDAFIKVTFEEDVRNQQAGNAVDPLYDPWVDQASSKFSEPAVFSARQLRKLYPNHSITLVNDGSVNIFGFPGALVRPVSLPDVISTVWFIPLARRLAQVPGVLVDDLSFGLFQVAWDKYEFLVYVVKYPYGLGSKLHHIVLYEGSDESPSRAFLMAAGAWHAQLHEEIMVYNSGYWEKNHNLWVEVQKAHWEDVILKEEFKATFKKDIYGFFDSEKLYKSLSIPWKRGIIMFGPPGNGKTISIKAVIKDCDEKGYTPLYVKSFKSWKGEEASMQEVFDQARQMAPSVLILEDLDSLINDSNRSFFLNQVDGLEGNDGLLIIGTTNHADRLDPALTNRPSRFDRKYLFDDPDEEERTLYIQYWQNKLKNNETISFPDSLVKDIAAQTHGFSFAYLKEAFVATLVLLAGYEDRDRPEFGDLLRNQVKALRKQLDEDKGKGLSSIDICSGSATSGVLPLQAPDGRPPKFDGRLVGQNRIWSTTPGPVGTMPGGLPVGPAQQGDGGRKRELRNLASAFGRSFVS